MADLNCELENELFWFNIRYEYVYKETFGQSINPAVTKLQPAGQIRPAKDFYPALQKYQAFVHKLFNIGFPKIFIDFIKFHDMVVN
jgi:hypothetical protein